jgi:hypothetical protein
VYAPPLAGLKHEQVHPEAAHAQRAPQCLEALVAVAIKLGKRDVGLGHRLLAGQGGHSTFTPA